MNYSDYVFRKPLKEIDPEIAGIIEYEEERQARKIILIPSESICPSPVLQALGSAFNNIYAEGYPPTKMTDEDEELILDFNYQMTRLRRYSDRRFYKGCDYADFLETLAQRRAATIFATEKNPSENIYVNIQPLSGAAANNAVYDAFVKPGDVVMGMSLMHGGHLTHGSEFNRSGKNYRIVSYEVNAKTEKLDYDEIMALAKEHRPKMIIAGYTSYPWAPDWEKFKEIADSVEAILLADIAHPAGLIVGGVFPNPIDYADVITCTTHKTLFGPRGAIIMTTKKDYAEIIDQAVFPGEQGGPHVNKFAAMAVAFKIAQGEEFKKTQEAIVENARYLANVLEKDGLKLAYGGTDTHLLLIDLNTIKTESGFSLKGEIAVRILDLCGIVANKNTIPGDTITAEASGIRLGTPWITQRGIDKEGIEELGSVIAYILKNINPFTYIGLIGDLPRGKIELGIFEKAKKRVDRLARSLISEKLPEGTGYPHYSGAPASSKGAHPELKDNNILDKCILIVKGERALQFLEQVSTNIVFSLKEGEGCKSFLLESHGKLLAHIYIHRLQKEKFLIICRPEDKEDITDWLRGLSDGYIAFDRDDIFRKIEGPAVILAKNDISDKEIECIRRAIKSIDIADLDLSRHKRGVDSRALYNSSPEFFHISKPYFIAQNSIVIQEGDIEKEKFSFKKVQEESKKSCLYEEHLKLTKNFVEFAGWKMPGRYEGIVEEHSAVREAAGIFDISHMGVIDIRGEYATHFLDVISTNYVPWIDSFESQYSYLLDTEGNVIDDIMVYKLSADRYILIVNAINNNKDLAWMNAVNSQNIIIDNTDIKKRILSKVVIRDLKEPSSGEDCMVDIALQGPQSLNILKRIAKTEEIRSALERIERMQFMVIELGGIEMIVSRTGYTGEDIGYELLIHPSRARALWNMVLDLGKRFGVKPVGLGARDSLRIEAGLPLYGYELAGPNNISPIEAGFGPYVKFHKPFFIGREPLLSRMKEMKMEIVRFRMNLRGVRRAKQNDIVVSKRSQRVMGAVTSCAVDKDGVQVGMAYVDKRFSREGTKIGIIAHTDSEKDGSISSDQIRLGHKFQLHDEAVIISRFSDRE